MFGRNLGVCVASAWGLVLLAACGKDQDVVVGRLHAEQEATDSGQGQGGRDEADSAADLSPPDAGVIPPGQQVTSVPEPDSQPTNDPLTDAAAVAIPGSSTDSGAANAAPNCATPAALHHYRFSGTGTLVPDLAGGADAELFGGAALDESGVLELDGEDDYVQIPAGVLAGLDSVTLAVWVARNGGPAYVRILDFGTSSEGADPAEGSGSVGRSYLALTPGTGLPANGLAALASAGGSSGEVAIATDLDVSGATLHQVLLVVDAAAAQLSLYFDGELAGSQNLPFALSEIEDVNNWLGRSQYDADPYFRGRYAELSIYGTALSGCQVQTSWRAGVPSL